MAIDAVAVPHFLKLINESCEGPEDIENEQTRYGVFISYYLEHLHQPRAHITSHSNNRSKRPPKPKRILLLLSYCYNRKSQLHKTTVVTKNNGYKTIKRDRLVRETLTRRKQLWRHYGNDLFTIHKIHRTTEQSRTKHAYLGDTPRRTFAVAIASFIRIVKC